MKNFPRSKRGIITFIFLLLFIIIVLGKLGVLKAIQNSVIYLISPIQRTFFTASQKTKSLAVFFENRKKLKQENLLLHEKIAALSSENVKLNEKLKNINLTEKQIKFLEKSDYQGVNAKIISLSSDNYRQMIIINQGSQKKIKNGFPVIADSGIIIGKVFETEKYSSKVLLLNDPQSQISALIKNKKSSPGIVSGQYGLSLIMDLIPQDDPINIGDNVVTSGIEKDIPGNLVIGSILNINKKDGQLFQQAIIQPLIDYHQLKVVTVIIPKI